ncbi:hypothetical protein [Spongiactinospora sp. TRM90649]|uniref:alpha/beta hydrolase family protein n=1 Tax=Spongiactinospora sp. TRM90649 TaxID=3031114 RepID=UPI0023F733F8|nr:hypothetical protein [Spongiactinospora sp. TRM90649]
MEVVVLVAAVLLIIGPWLPYGVRRPVVLGAGAVFVPAAVALIVMGIRWQWLPVLAGGAIGLAFALPKRQRQRRRRLRTIVGSVTGLLLVLAGAGTAWALPVPVFPAPSGPYATGTTVVEWADPDREETATARRDDRRTVVVQFWYPAAESLPATERAWYLGRTPEEARVVAQGVAGYLGAPGFVLDGPVRARTRSVYDAPAAQGAARFPVVLFSPGLGGVRTQNTAWAEELAARGYVVAALDHPYDSAVVVMGDGRAVRTKVAATGDAAEDERRAARWTATRAADLSFVLTRLDRGAAPKPLAGRLDTRRAAATGHSLGGAAALLAVRQDTRFTAAVDLDGFPRDPAPRPFHRPVLAVTHEITPGQEREYLDRLARVLRLSTAAGYLLKVPDTAHLTFTDAPLYLPPLPGLVGTTGPHLTAQITGAFLDATLRDARGDLPALLAGYGDLEVFAKSPFG